MLPKHVPDLINEFPSLFRDSSDHHTRSLKVKGVVSFVFPSLFRDSSDHHPLIRISNMIHVNQVSIPL